MDYEKFYEEPPKLDGLIETLKDPNCPEDVVVDVLTEKIDWYDWVLENVSDDYPYLHIVEACLGERQLSGEPLARAIKWFLSMCEGSLGESGMQFVADLFIERDPEFIVAQKELSGNQLDDLATMFIRCDNAFSDSCESSEVLGAPVADGIFADLMSHLNAKEETKVVVKKFLLDRKEKGIPYQ